MATKRSQPTNWMELNDKTQLPALGVLVYAGRSGGEAQSNLHKNIKAKQYEFPCQELRKVKLFLNDFFIKANAYDEVDDSESRIYDYNAMQKLKLVTHVDGRVNASEKALVEMIAKATIFSDINQAVKEQKRDWRVEKDKPVLVEKWFLGDIERMEHALAEQGIKAEITQRKVKGDIKITISNSDSLERLKLCIDQIDKIRPKYIGMM